jgi:hypothetical protein
VDAEQVKAAVTLALDAAMDTMVDQIARQVLAALQSKKPVEAGPAETEEPKPAAHKSEPVSRGPVMETVRKVNTLRLRSSSILGLDASQSPESRPPAPEK